MLALDNRTQIALSTSLLEEIAREICAREVELLLVDEAQIRELNRAYRDKDAPTDVLSFPLDDMGLAHMPLGSVVICLPIAQKFATHYGHSLQEEVALLFIHGILHLQGYDHEVDGGEHRREEERWIEAFGLPSSLIVRNTQEEI